VGINVANDIPPRGAHEPRWPWPEVVPDVRRIDVLDRLVPALPRVTTHRRACSPSRRAQPSRGDCCAAAVRAPVMAAPPVCARTGRSSWKQGGTIGVREAT